MSNALVIVEGEVTEIKILENFFKKMGLEVIKEEKYQKFSKLTFSNEKNTVYLIPGPNPQVASVIKEFKSSEDELYKYFGISETIALNFIVYDVDTTKIEDIDELYETYNTPDVGLIVLSNPCFEVIADKELKKIEGFPKKYKKDIYKQCGGISEKGFVNFVNENIIDLLIFHINLNRYRYNSNNVLDHTKKAYKSLSDNTCINESYEYKELFSVLYVLFAYMRGLVSKSIDNVDNIIKELKKLG